jgi:hypothetical protein
MTGSLERGESSLIYSTVTSTDDDDNNNNE